jgi:hypothetical protein
MRTTNRLFRSAAIALSVTGVLVSASISASAMQVNWRAVLVIEGTHPFPTTAECMSGACIRVDGCWSATRKTGSQNADND